MGGSTVGYVTLVGPGLRIPLLGFGLFLGEFRYFAIYYDLLRSITEQPATRVVL